MLKDVEISGDRNMMEKEAENILKYTDFIIEIQLTWNIKENVIPVLTGSTGNISKSLRQYLSNITGKYEIKELYKQLY
jgi:hypothetical protein